MTTTTPIILTEHSPKHHIPAFDKNLEAFLETLDQPAWLINGIRGKYLWINSAGLKPLGKKDKDDFINTVDSSAFRTFNCHQLSVML